MERFLVKLENNAYILKWDKIPYFGVFREITNII